MSLHGHTLHSRENLRFLNSYRDSIPPVGWLLRLAAAEHRRLTGEIFRPERAFWRPPLDPKQAWELEASQIAGLGLQPLISLTDHDEIAAGLEIAGAPVSLEWSLPFGPSLFHLGIHNLPRNEATDWYQELMACSARPEPSRLRSLLAALDRLEQVLIVLNHPYWDGCRVGAASHAVALGAFLGQYRPFLHALEANGLRPARENQQVLNLAQCWGLPVVAGGDRHGREASSCFNISRARSFTEFVSEVRKLRESHIVFTEAYRASARWRWLRFGHDILRKDAMAGDGVRHWTESFFYEFDDGRVLSLRECWGRQTARCLSPCVAVLKLAALPGARKLSSWLFADGGEFGIPLPTAAYLWQAR